MNDTPAIDPIADVSVDEDATEQLIDLSGILAGPDDESGQELTITATSDNPSVVANPTIEYTPGDSTGTLKFTPVANASGTATITVTVTDDGGTANGGVNTFTQTFTIDVGQQPDRPVIDTVPTPMLPPVPLKTNPTGAPVGTLLVNVTDADPNALKGMAVTAVDISHGMWQFSTNGGTSWSDITGVSEAKALLLADLPDTRNGETQGSSDNTSAAAGDGAYSTATERAWVAVGKTTPKVDTAGHPRPTAMKEDAKSSAAFTAKSLLGILRLEAGVAATSGIAVSGVGPVGGKWQFNVGTGWKDVGAVSAAQALLLRPIDRLRFQPNHDFNGQTTLTYHTWTPVKGQQGTRAPATGGGFSAATETAILDVSAVNDAPILDLLRGVTLDPVTAAGQSSNAVTFGSLLAATDVDSSNIGVAITKVAGKGTWEFSRDDGTTWSPVAPVSVLKALLLTATDMIRFTAAVDATAGPAALSYRAWDQFNQFPGTAGQKVPIRGTAFSKATEVLTVAVLNSTPTLDTSGSPTFPPVRSTGLPGTGAVIRSLLGTSITDVDAGALKGIAITSADNANGKWQYLVGIKWIDVGAVTKDSALLLADSTRLRFVPNSGFVGSATIQYKAWDRTAGQAGDRIDTDSGLNSFSSAIETATITVKAWE